MQQNKTTDKIYCGNGKRIHERGMRISVCLDRIPAEHVTQSKTGERWVNLTVWTNAEPDRFGNDASVQVDTWKPQSKDGAQTQQQTRSAGNTAQAFTGTATNDLPF